MCIVEVNCMNMCKRGPNVRIVADGDVQMVPERMSATEQQRGAFQSIGPKKVAPIWDVVCRIADGSLRDSYGEFTTSSRGPLPPSAV